MNESELISQKLSTEKDHSEIDAMQDTENLHEKVKMIDQLQSNVEEMRN